MISDADAYSAHFADVYEGQKFLADLTPTYALLDEAGFRKMRDLFPDCLYLFILRNPVERFWSHLRFAAGNVREIPSMDRAEKLLGTAQFWERTDYPETLARLRSVVPDGAIFVCFYEDLFGDPDVGHAEIERFEKFCDVAHVKAELGKVVAKSREIELPTDMRRRLVRLLSKVYYGVQRSVDAPLPASWKKDMRDFL